MLKSLYWETSEQLAFRFNLKVFNEKINEIGRELPPDYKFEKPTLFLRGSKSDYILDEDFLMIEHHFPLGNIETISNAGHWLHAENPSDFYSSVMHFLNK